MVLLLFRIEEVSFLFFLPHIVVYTTCCFPLLWIIFFKRISLALKKLGGCEGRKLGKTKYNHFHRSVKWVPSADTVQMSPHNSFEDTEILTAIISPRVFPGQIPANARVSKTNSFVHGYGRRFLFSALCDLIEKNGTGLKWPGRGSTGHQWQSMK